MSDIERIFEQIEAGNTLAFDEELVPLLYDELRALASRRLAKEPARSLQTTELVHEAYLRLVGPNRQWNGQAHFFGAAAEAMRRVLVDRARKNRRVKHGGEMQRMPLNESDLGGNSSSVDILIINDLFDRLEQLHPKEAQVAKLRYFASFRLEEIADALDISVGAVHKYWMFARAWLYREYQK
ncbi:MAG: ECF-type sigma factor [Pirellulaceae bacterium]